MDKSNKEDGLHKIIKNPQIAIECLSRMKGYAIITKNEILIELIEELENTFDIKIPIK